LIVITREASAIVQRWSLETFEREVTSTLTLKVPLEAVAMGSASAGPLCISAVDYPRLGETAFFDIQKMKRLEDAIPPHNGFETNRGIFLRASANGQLFTAQAGGGMQSAVLTGTKAVLHGGAQASWPVPGP